MEVARTRDEASGPVSSSLLSRANRSVGVTWPQNVAAELVNMENRAPYHFCLSPLACFYFEQAMDTLGHLTCACARVAGSGT